MIGIENAYAYCKEDISLIENYDMAISDDKNVWVCHHRDEIKILPSGIVVLRSVEELIENKRYYNCTANELIFMTNSEHVKLHAKYRKSPTQETREKISNSLKGKLTGRKFSDETKMKLSIAAKNRPARTQEHTEKLRQAMLGKKLGPCSEERKRKISEALKGRQRVIIDGRIKYVKENNN